MKEVFVQIGLTALRAPDGSFLPAVPLYVKATPQEVDPAGHYIGDEPALNDVAGIFADKFKQYADAKRAAAIRR